MSRLFEHRGCRIVVLETMESPDSQCQGGDLFLAHNGEGYIVSEWDGANAYPINEHVHRTFDGALVAAKRFIDGV